MSPNHRERISAALELLRQGLYPYLEQNMQKIYGDAWKARAAGHLRDFQRAQMETDDPLREDVAAQLTVINREWEKVFKQGLSPSDRALINELIAVRNKWAHQSPFSTDDTYRAVDSVARLLKSLNAPQVATVEKQRQDILRLLAQEQARSEIPPTLLSPAEEAQIVQRLGALLKAVPFQNVGLLNQALTHTSYKYENPNTGEDNEQLEFIGDAVLALLSCDYVYQQDPGLREGDMTEWRARLVGDGQLAQYAARLELGQWIRIGKGEERNGGRQKTSLLSNAFEALVGAYYLDSGIEVVRDMIYPFFDDVWSQLADSDATMPRIDVKSRLQQVVLHPDFSANPNRQPPEYKTIRSGGTDNDPEFTAVVYVAGGEYGSGKGRSKKEAERRAAEAALAKIETMNG